VAHQRTQWSIRELSGLSRGLTGPLEAPVVHQTPYWSIIGLSGPLEALVVHQRSL